MNSKNPYPSLLTTALVICAVLLCPQMTKACAVCVNDAADYFLPPFVLWFFFSVGWFMATVITISSQREKVPGIPGITGAALLLFIVFMAGAAFFGLPVMLLFLFPPLFLTARIFVPRGLDHWNERLVRDLRWLGSVGLIVLFALGSLSIYVRTHQTKLEYCLQKRNPAITLSLISELKAREPESLPDYRRLVREGTGHAVTMAAERLKILGDARTDVPLLIAALERHRSTRFRDSVTESIIERILRNLSGIDLPENSSVELWSKSWDEKKKQPATEKPVSEISGLSKTQ